MPDKHPNPREWGGPGSSEQNADKPAPAPHDPHPPGTPTNTPQSDVSPRRVVGGVLVFECAAAAAVAAESAPPTARRLHADGLT